VIILCNGMPRSGSTWSFNVVKSLIQRTTPTESLYSGYSENISAFLSDVPAGTKHIVLKCHGLTPAGKALASAGAAKVIYTWRDPADAVYSQMKMFSSSFDEALRLVEASLALYVFHRVTGNSISIYYDDFVAHQAPIIHGICGYMGISNVDNAVIDEIADTMSIDNIRLRVAEIEALPKTMLVQARTGYCHWDTQLHYGHIREGGSGNGRRQLTSDQVALIDSLVSAHGITLPPLRTVGRRVIA
jgi:hypothetical protein